MMRIVLPPALRVLAQVPGTLELALPSDATIGQVLDALEAAHPALRGTLRDQTSKRRRAFVRFYACEEDWSHRPPDEPLPEAVRSGREPLLIVGAMAGG